MSYGMRSMFEGLVREKRERIAELEAEVAELRRDKARLVWLEAHHRALNATYGPWYHWSIIRSHNVTRLMLGDVNTLDVNDADPRGGPDIRAALDMAIGAAR
jgi:hypothetical protein